MILRCPVCLHQPYTDITIEKPNPQKTIFYCLCGYEGHQEDFYMEDIDTNDR